MKEKIINFFSSIGMIFSAICIIYTIQSFIEKDVGGYLFWGNIIFCDEEGICFHELGHVKNAQLDYPSESSEFQKAIEEYLEWCVGGRRFWPTECEHLETFPGINGNELRNGRWGGYEELYADLFRHMTWSDRLMPENVKIFFNIHWRSLAGR